MTYLLRFPQGFSVPSFHRGNDTSASTTLSCLLQVLLILTENEPLKYKLPSCYFSSWLSSPEWDSVPWPRLLDSPGNTSANSCVLTPTRPVDVNVVLFPRGPWISVQSFLECLCLSTSVTEALQDRK